MSLILPFSDSSQFSTGGIWEPTAANFPALKHLFKCDESTSASASTITDSIGNVVLTVPTSLTNNADGTISFGGTVSAIASGAWADPTGKHVLLMMSAKPPLGAAAITVGTVTAGNSGIRFNANASGSCTVSTSSSTVSIVNPVTDNGTAGTWAISAQYGSATGLNAYGILAASTSVTAATPVDISTLTASETFIAAVSMSPGLRPAMISVYHFTTIPSANFIKSMMVWQHYYAFNSVGGAYNKWIYPALKGVS